MNMKDSVLQIIRSGSKLIPFLVSPPGVGKTAFAQQLAKELGVSLHIYNCASIDELDLSGLPTNTDSGVAFTPPKSYSAGIIFFDEIDRVQNASVHNSLLSLFRDRALNGNKTDAIIIAAGNQEFDQACNLFDSKSAFFDRLLRINFNYTEEERKEYLRNKYPGNIFASWATNNFDLLSKFTPRRIDEAICIGENMISNTLDSATAVAFQDFLNKRISAEAYLEGAEAPENSIVVSALLTELGEKVEKWIDNEAHVGRVNSLYDSGNAESKVAFVEELGFQIRRGRGPFFLAKMQKAMPTVYTLLLKY